MTVQIVPWAHYVLYMLIARNWGNKKNQTFQYLLFGWEVQLLNPILLIISALNRDFRLHTQPFVFRLCVRVVFFT